MVIEDFLAHCHSFGLGNHFGGVWGWCEGSALPLYDALMELPAGMVGEYAERVKGDSPGRGLGNLGPHAETPKITGGDQR